MPEALVGGSRGAAEGGPGGGPGAVQGRPSSQAPPVTSSQYNASGMSGHSLFLWREQAKHKHTFHFILLYRL